jgi:hypothetical protein
VKHLVGPVWVPDTPTPCQWEPEAWFDPAITTGAGNRARARALCAPCTVRDECLAAALRYENSADLIERHGVWGGTLPIERDMMHRRGQVTGGGRL